jgi:hypothetical protein
MIDDRFGSSPKLCVHIMHKKFGSSLVQRRKYLNKNLLNESFCRRDSLAGTRPSASAITYLAWLEQMISLSSLRRAPHLIRPSGPMYTSNLLHTYDHLIVSLIETSYTFVSTASLVFKAAPLLRRKNQFKISSTSIIAVHVMVVVVIVHEA